MDTASERLEPGEEFVAYYWDVESGMLPPELRGLGPQEMYDALGVPTPRTGGLQDLIDRAEILGITHALAERSDRIARAMLTSLTVEHALKKTGTEVVYANEPTGGTESGRLRARRYSQVDAEVFKATLMEMSTGGQIQHAVQGWNHGYPPYPYIAVVDEDAPVPTRGRFGATRPKRKLVPHPDARRGEAVREMYRLRREERLTDTQIVTILAADRDRYPIERHWTYNRVYGLLSNPKLTGYQVYNRKASRTGRQGFSRLNPVSEWVWSPEIVHEPVVSLEEWKQTQEVTAELRTRAGSGTGLSRVRAAARELGYSVTLINRSGTHALYQIGGRRMALPSPLPELMAQQVIDDLRRQG
ncbi:recombinase family protein [Streptomyces buecherae]|uniref:recombinase family protein n=1 Tax=Streptomyces buecherae TaxID=2763006 RepID=UPI00164E251E|nr:recombinase family protein [Streptomyces buecherae]QNJ42015.1 recombinase family protein [Streptomyces buecherae]